MKYIAQVNKCITENRKGWRWKCHKSTNITLAGRIYVVFKPKACRYKKDDPSYPQIWKLVSLSKQVPSDKNIFLIGNTTEGIASGSINLPTFEHSGKNTLLSTVHSVAVKFLQKASTKRGREAPWMQVTLERTRQIWRWLEIHIYPKHIDHRARFQRAM